MLMLIIIIIIIIMKKRPERRKHCALAVLRRSQKFSPRGRPLSRGRGTAKYNQLEMVTTFIYRPSLVKIDARNFRVIMVTDPHTNKLTKTQTGPITIHCAAS